MNRVLLTGASSFIGRALARRLGQDGIAVHAVLRPSSDRARLADISGLTEHVHDGTTDSLVAILSAAQPDVIFHLAGKYLREHTSANMSDLMRDNILFGCQLLEAMRATGARRLVHAASFFQHMDGAGYRPLNLYAATKQAFEDLLAYYADACGYAAVSLVLFDVYGKGDWRQRLVPSILRAVRTGDAVSLPADDPRVDLVYVDDVVEAFVAAGRMLLEKPESVAGRRFAVAPERRYTLSEVITAFESASGRPIPVKRGAWPAPARAIMESWRGPPVPGWRTKISLDEGVRRLLAEPQI